MPIEKKTHNEIPWIDCCPRTLFDGFLQPFIGAHRIQEPVILCEPQIMTSHKRLARVLTAGDGGFIR
jgi:hypothetical protein